jgi:hypothetical protein
VCRRPEALLRGALGREAARGVARGVYRGAGELFSAALGVGRHFRIGRIFITGKSRHLQPKLADKAL